MKKIYNKKIIIPLFLILVVFIIIQYKKNNETTLLIENNIISEKNIEENTSIPEIEIKNKIKVDEFVSLHVLDKEYKTLFQEGDNVYEIMKKARDYKNNGFSFVSKEYSGLGVFINEINGVVGESGKYWIYYVNNIKASVGVSKYILKPGDKIKWKQE